MKLTASQLARAIYNLDRNISYSYVNTQNKGLIRISQVSLPEGPIVIKRYNPSKQQKPDDAVEESISSQMLWRLANALLPNRPVNVVRLFAGSYNTRSVLEALLAHTPDFYTCLPGRIEVINSSSKIRKGHKHLMWCPDDPHAEGIIVAKETNMTISELASEDIVYDAIIPDEAAPSTIDPEIKRRHLQMQISLALIGTQLGFRTWIAQNDRGTMYRGRKLSEMDGVVASLTNEPMIAPHDGAIDAAKFIDCIWFRNKKYMPAVIEVEHSTGVASGLNRMKGLQERLPEYLTRYVIVAPDEDRDKVLANISEPQFKSLKTWYFSYSSVEELRSLCEKRKVKGITDEFLECYLEKFL